MAFGHRGWIIPQPVTKAPIFCAFASSASSGVRRDVASGRGAPMLDVCGQVRDHGRLGARGDRGLKWPLRALGVRRRGVHGGEHLAGRGDNVASPTLGGGCPGKRSPD